MLRRLYFLFPRPEQAQAAVSALSEMGIAKRRLHAIARAGVDASGLPAATDAQRSDAAARMEQLLWSANLLLFFAALAGLVLAAWQGSALWAGICLLTLLATFLAGSQFARHVPNAHLDQFQGALSHKEVLLLVDVPRWKVRQTERLVRRHDPAADLGGVGWTIEAMGL